jgi:hypothetical protein
VFYNIAISVYPFHTNGPSKTFYSRSTYGAELIEEEKEEGRLEKKRAY